MYLLQFEEQYLDDVRDLIKITRKDNLAKINYISAETKKFSQHPKLRKLRGSVFSVNKGRYRCIYRAMDKFDNLVIKDASVGNFDACIEKLDGMMILPYVINQEVYFSSRYSFDSDPVKEAYKYGEQYKQFILKSYLNRIYLTFELISLISFIKVFYAPSDYGLYLVASQDENGRPYPLEKVDGKIYVTNGKQKVLVPKFVKTAKIFSYQDPLSINALVNSFDGREFEGVVVYKDGKPYKIKSDSYMYIGSSQKAFIQDICTSIFTDSYKDELDDVGIYHEIKKEWISFKEHTDSLIERTKDFSSKAEIAEWIKEHNFPKHYHLMYYQFEGRNDDVKHIIRSSFVRYMIEKFSTQN